MGLVRKWAGILESTIRRKIGIGTLPLSLPVIANALQTAMIILNNQVAALRTPWAVLDYDAMVTSPQRCALGLSRFLSLPLDALLAGVKGVKRGSSHGSHWSTDELDWINDTLDSEAAVA